MKKKIGYLFLIILLTLSACGNSAEESESEHSRSRKKESKESQAEEVELEYNTVFLNIYDAAVYSTKSHRTGGNLDNVNIEFYDYSCNFVDASIHLSQVSKDDGITENCFEISLPKGKYQMQLSLEGYEPAKYFLDADSISNASMEYFLIPELGKGQLAVLFVWEDCGHDFDLIDVMSDFHGNYLRIGGTETGKYNGCYQVADNSHGCELTYFNMSNDVLNQFYLFDSNDPKRAEFLSNLKGCNAYACVFLEDWSDWDKCMFINLSEWAGEQEINGDDDVAVQIVTSREGLAMQNFKIDVMTEADWYLFGKKDVKRLVKKEKSDYDYDYTEVIEYAYDENGNMITQYLQGVGNGWYKNELTQYGYDTYGRLISEEVFADGSIPYHNYHEKTSYEYDNLGFQVKKENVTEDKITIEYYEKGKWYLTETYDANGTLLSQKDVESVKEDDEGEIRTYDEYGNLLSSEYHGFYAEMGYEYVSKHEWRYDDFGRMLEESDLSKNVNRGSYSYSYKYDKFGKVQRFDDDFNTIYYYYDEYGNVLREDVFLSEYYSVENDLTSRTTYEYEPIR